jgi:hypothetical protein
LKFSSSFLPSCLETKSWQKTKSINSFYIKMIFLPKKSSPKDPHQNILPKKSFNKISSKKIQKIRPKNSIPPKNSKQFLKKFLIFKISNSLYGTWRPKTLSGLFLICLSSWRQGFNSVCKVFLCHLFFFFWSQDPRTRSVGEVRYQNGEVRYQNFCLNSSKNDMGWIQTSNYSKI